MAESDPQAEGERRVAARHLLADPLTCDEHDPTLFRLIRRHETELGRWFTQRLGYRLHLDADTARLFKTGATIANRPLRTASGRALTQLEVTLLALALGATTAGPAIVSLRDLVAEVRSAAVEAGIALPGEAIERRSFVSALRWMIDQGLAVELHEHVDAFATDDQADAILRLRPDRIALVLVPGTAGSEDGPELLARGERRGAGRQWMRIRLVEDPVLYRDDLTPEEWAELRRRLGEEERLLDEMFGLALEVRAEGVAAVDPGGDLADRRFPTTGTVGHAALLLLEHLVGSTGADPVPLAAVATVVGRLAEEHSRRWSKELVERPDRLTTQVLGLLCDLRLAVVGEHDTLRLLPAAARFRPVVPDATQGALW